jgi:two-component sensor histidine kinase
MAFLRALGRWDPYRRSAAFRWTFAAAAVVLSVGLRFALDDVLPTGYPFLTFFPAVVLTAFFAGFWPGTTVAVLCAVAAEQWFLSTDGPVGPRVLAMAFFAGIVAANIFLVTVMHRALRVVALERAEAKQQAEARRLMFQELQHRTSNHLTMLSGLMKMQRRQISDPVARKALDDSVSRLMVVARLQRLLHDPAAQTVNLARFLEDMAHEVAQSTAIEGRVAVTVAAQSVIVDADTAVPFGLIATELVSNAVEHGFPGARAGRIRVRLASPAERQVRLEIDDDGVGPRPGFVLAETKSLGLRLAAEFADQLGGTLTIEPRPEGGTLSRLEFPVAAPRAPDPSRQPDPRIGGAAAAKA